MPLLSVMLRETDSPEFFADDENAVLSTDDVIERRRKQASNGERSERR